MLLTRRCKLQPKKQRCEDVVCLQWVKVGNRGATSGVKNPAQVQFPLCMIWKLQSHLHAEFKHVSPFRRSQSLADECKAIFGTEPVWRLRAARRKNVTVCTKESNGNFTECALMDATAQTRYQMFHAH